MATIKTNLNKNNENNAKATRNKIVGNNRFMQHFVAAADSRLLEKPGLKPIQEARLYIKDTKYYSKNTIMVSNSYGNTSKTVGVYAPNIPLAPLTEASKASKRARTYPLLSNLIFRIADFKFGLDRRPLGLYFLTLTVPNCDLNELKQRYDELTKNLTRFEKHLQNGNNGKGKLQFEDQNGDVSRFLGGRASFEVTTNRRKLNQNNEHGLFHPHIHFPIVFESDLDRESVEITRKDVPNMYEKRFIMGVSAAKMFIYWASLFPNLKMSAAAFKLTHLDSMEDDDAAKLARNMEKLDDDEKEKQRKFTKVTKYSAKPADWSRFPKQPTEFSKKAFAALCNAQKNVSKQRSYGIFRVAQGFINFAKNARFLTPALNAYVQQRKSKSELYIPNHNYVPDLYTKSKALMGDKYHYTSDLSIRDLLYFNRSLLEKLTFDDSVFDSVKFPQNDKGQLYRYLVNSLQFINGGKQGVIRKLKGYQNIVQRKINYIESIGDLDDKLQAVLAYNIARLDDLERLCSAVSGLKLNYVQMRNYIMPKIRARLWSKLTYIRQDLQTKGLFGKQIKDDNYFNKKNLKGCKWWKRLYNATFALSDEQLFNLIWNFDGRIFNKEFTTKGYQTTNQATKIAQQMAGQFNCTAAVISLFKEVFFAIEDGKFDDKTFFPYAFASKKMSNYSFVCSPDPTELQDAIDNACLPKNERPNRTHNYTEIA